MTNQPNHSLSDRFLENLGHLLRENARKFTPEQAVRAKKILYLLAFGVYLLCQTNLTLSPLLAREFPIEPDDAYSYMVKAAEISSGCLQQKCTALNDLREQFLAPADDLSLVAYRNRQYHRIFVFYSPIHSILLSSLHAIGLNFEEVYEGISVLGRIFILIAVAYWLQIVWGQSATTVALILMITVVFNGQGLHYIVPGNLALGFAFLAWALIYRNPERLGGWLIPLIVVIAFMHPVGKIYALAAVFLYFLFSKVPFGWKTSIVGGTSLVLVLVALLLPSWIERPELRFDPTSFYPGEWEYFDSIEKSLMESSGIFRGWATLFGGIYLFAALVIFAMVSQRHDFTKRFFMGVLLLGITCISLFYIVPFYGALAFERIWTAMLIFLIGAVGASVSTILGFACRQLRLNLTQSGSKKKKPRRGWIVVLNSFIIIGFVFYFTNYFVSTTQTYAVVSESMRWRYNIDINTEQARLIFNSNEKTETVLYMHEISLYYFLIYGGMDHGAIFYPALVHTPELKFWLDERAGHITHLVAFNPIFRLPVSPNGAILLNRGEELRVGLETIDVRDMQLLIGERSENIVLHFIIGEGVDRMVFIRHMESGGAQWISIFETDLPLGEMTIQINQADHPVEIAGIRFSEQTTTLWPWEANISLVFFNGVDEIRVEISEGTLLENLPTLDLEILDDKGYSVLARIIN